jgi:type III restriction enzyme
MSFRRAIDSTTIAQLVGRMVRTPLARRIDLDEKLNTVALYLPRYDTKGVEQVIRRLTADDPDTLPPISVEQGDGLVSLNRAPSSDPLFKALEDLPTYVLPGKRKIGQIHRLAKMGRALANSAIDPQGPLKVERLLLKEIAREFNRAKSSKEYRKFQGESEKLDVTALNISLGGERQGSVSLQLDPSPENIDDIFAEAGRKLGEGLHKLWWVSRVNDGADKTEAKLELVATLAIRTDLVERLEEISKHTVQNWFVKNKIAISELSDAQQAVFDDIRSMAPEPELSRLSHPESILVRTADDQWPRHVYQDAEGMFPAKLNSWESAVLTEELQDPSVVGWLRNVDRKPWSLCVPYQSVDGDTKPLYPDFIVLRRTHRAIVADVLDPHHIGLADAPLKAAGLARFAERHEKDFGRLQLIVVDDGKIKRLDLANEGTRQRVKGVLTTSHLKQLFQDA